MADRLEQFDLAIFISPTAVQKAFELLRARHPERRWPDQVRVAAIGGGSGRELERQGLHGGPRCAGRSRQRSAAGVARAG
jgi:uroporphyrinogen-III synthase